MAKRILIADRLESDRRLAAILAGNELVFVRTLGEAQRMLRERRFDLVLVGVHFDESRMFDLMREVTDGTQVVCVRSQQFQSHAITLEGLEIAAKALGCALFLDLTWYADDETGNGAVRKLIDALLSPAS
jgi:DNA-binding response OmpR family regulator